VETIKGKREACEETRKPRKKGPSISDLTLQGGGTISKDGAAPFLSCGSALHHYSSPEWGTPEQRQLPEKRINVEDVIRGSDKGGKGVRSGKIRDPRPGGTFPTDTGDTRSAGRGSQSMTQSW